MAFGALALGVYGGYTHATSDEVKNTGLSSIGILTEFEDTGSGAYAVVAFVDDTGAGVYAHSRRPIDDPDENRIGANFTVYFDKDHDGDTFIEGVDSLSVPWELYSSAAGVLLVGVVLMVAAPGRKVVDSDGTRLRRSKRRRQYEEEDAEREDMFIDGAEGRTFEYRDLSENARARPEQAETKRSTADDIIFGR